MTHSEIVSFLRGVADLIRDTFKRGRSPSCAGSTSSCATWSRRCGTVSTPRPEQRPRVHQHALQPGRL